MSTHTLLIVATADVAQARKDVGDEFAFLCPLVLGVSDAKTGAVTHYAAGVDAETAEQWAKLLTVPVKRQDGELRGDWTATLMQREAVKRKEHDLASEVIRGK